MAGYENWDRQYRLAAGPGGGTGFEIGAVTAECPVPLHINFSAEKGDKEASNTAKVSIWNLNDEHLAVLNQKDCVISLHAGYGKNMPLIFAGVVSFVKTQLDGADRETEIEIVDKLVALRDTYVSVNYSGKISWKEIMDDVAAQLGVAISYSYNASFSDLNNGFSFVGNAKDIMSKGCNSCGLSWSIQNGVLQVKKPNDVMSKEVYVLSADTGLINIPSRFSEEKATSKSDTGSKKAKQSGWEVNYLLNGAIGIDDYVRLESKVASGYYRVYKLSHSGDNVTGDWVSAAQLVEAK